MGKASSGSDMGTSTPFNAVFIDTSLDTHLAMIVSDVDTVSDIKKKLMYEHPLCFPNIGEIKILALKVKRKGCYYHLSDSMLVKSAFDGVKKSWFLSVDASSLEKYRENKLSAHPASSNPLPCITNSTLADEVDLLPDGGSKKLSIADDTSLWQVGSSQFMSRSIPRAEQFDPDDSIMEVLKDLEMEKHTSTDHCKTSSSDTTRRLDPRLQENFDQSRQGSEMIGRLDQCNEDYSQNEISKFQCNDTSERKFKSVDVAREKCKTKKKIEGVVDANAVKFGDASVDPSSKGVSQQEIRALQNSSDNARQGVSDDMVMEKRINDEPGVISSSDICKNLDSGMLKIDPREGTEVSEVHGECNKDKLNERTVDVQCNDLLGEASEARPANKKRKIKKKTKAEDPFKEKEVLICPSSKDTSRPDDIVPENPMDDKQEKITDAFNNLPAEPPQDVHLTTTTSNSRKRKRKNKSSSSCNETVSAVQEKSEVTLGICLKDSHKESDAATARMHNVQDAMHSEPSSISSREKHGDTVRGVGAVRKSSSPDINTSEVDTGNLGSKSNASDLGVEFDVRRRKSTRKHHADDTEHHPPKVVKEPNNVDDNILSGQGDIDSQDHHKSRSDQGHGTVKESGLSQINDPKVMLPENRKPSDQGEIQVNVEEVAVSSKLADGDGELEPGKSAGRGRKSKRAKNTSKKMQGESDIECRNDLASGIPVSEPHKAINSDHLNGEANKDKNVMSKTERIEIAEVETVNTSLLGAGEAHEMHGNMVESLQFTQTSNAQEVPANQVEKGRKKSKKKRSPAVEKLSELGMKDQGGGHKDPTASMDKIREVEDPSKMTKRSDLVETSSVNQINGSNLQPEKDSGRKTESVDDQASVDVASITNGHPDEANKRTEVSIPEGDKINFSQYFVPSQYQNEVAAPGEACDDKVIKVKKSERKVKARKNSKKVNMHPPGTSLDLLNSLKSDNHGSETESTVGNSSSIQGSLTKLDKLQTHSKRKSSKISGDNVEVEHYNDVDKVKSMTEMPRRPDAVKASETDNPTHTNLKENIDALAALSSSSERSVRKHQSHLNQLHMKTRKASGSNLGEIVDSSQHGRSLLATSGNSNNGRSLSAISGNIFNDDDGESSEYDGVVDSDASTRTPSDDSSSSEDYSEVENKAYADTAGTGSYGAKRKADGGKSFSSGMNVTLDTILRSSSRFKKAKLIASQSEFEDTESQPVDFVPDSQANL